MNQPTNCPEPRVQTDGSRERSPEQLAGPALAFDLTTEAAQVRQEASWRRNDRNARTLVQESGRRLLLVAVQAEAQLERHTAPGALTIQALSGRLRLTIAGAEKDLPVTYRLALDSNLPHVVEAIEESTFRLTARSYLAATARDYLVPLAAIEELDRAGERFGEQAQVHLEIY